MGCDGLGLGASRIGVDYVGWGKHIYIYTHTHLDMIFDIVG